MFIEIEIITPTPQNTWLTNCKPLLFVRFYQFVIFNYVMWCYINDNDVM